MLKKDVHALISSLQNLSSIPDRVVKMSQSAYVLDDFAATAAAAVQHRIDTINTINIDFVTDRAIASDVEPDVIMRLIDKKADVNAAISKAATAGKSNVVRALIAHPTARISKEMFGAAYAHVEIVRMLCSHVAGVPHAEKKAEAPTPSRSDDVPAAFVCKRPADVQVGDYIDAHDTSKIWLPAKVIAADAKNVKIHYLGWGTKFDETLLQTSNRLAVAGTKCTTLSRVEVGQVVSVRFSSGWLPAMVTCKNYDGSVKLDMHESTASHARMLYAYGYCGGK
jgi:hypothetical protein